MNDLIREGEREHLGWFGKFLGAVTPRFHSRYLNLLRITSAIVLRLTRFERQSAFNISGTLHGSVSIKVWL